MQRLPSACSASALMVPATSLKVVLRSSKLINGSWALSESETLSLIFDEKYEELQQEMAEDMDAVEALAYLNRELFTMIDNRVPLELLAQLLSSQLVTRGEKHLLDRNRTYFKLLHRIVRQGQFLWDAGDAFLRFLKKA